MTPNQPNTIYPCPFSKGYGIPTEQAWSLLKVFFIYRFITSTLFVALFYSQLGPSLLGTYNAHIYSYSSQAYWLVTIISGVCIFWRLFSYSSQAQSIIFIDIIFITLLMHTSGGINSGIGILLAVSIAAGGILIGGRCALLFAALASLAILSEQLYAIRTHAFESTSFTYAGMLGASFFTIAYLSYFLAKQTEQSEQLAYQHQQTISDLKELNTHIIQHLQSGIIISNSQQKIKMFNKATLSIMGHSEPSFHPQYLLEISSLLSQSFFTWINDNSQNFIVIKLPNENEIYCRFSTLETHQKNLYMVILEDIALYNQRLQQSKLASLGQLSASIAHEIRNPLGAISHASQLLSESPDLSVQDIRLSEIIQSHCLRVNKIIEDVLQLSRRQPSKREKINLYPWLQNHLSHFINDIHGQPDHFIIKEKTPNIFIYMDTGHLKQILDNLCSNALKYGDISKGAIVIEITQINDQPCIKFLDHGDEIEAKVVQRLFNPFFTTSPSGTGLGLYISKELAELNQAKLNYSPINGKSCFMLYLPNADSSKIEL